MTTERLDAVQVSEYTHSSGEVRKNYQRVGRAWRFDDGGITIVLDAIPIAHPNPKDPLRNTAVIKLYAPREQGTGGGQQGTGDQQRQQTQQHKPAQQGTGGGAASSGNGFEDDIPF